jgi:serine phosphatase RsbU (regulator of sigma subunit)
VRWSNAGHPPPVLLAPDGTTAVLTTPPDRLLGLTGGHRRDHELVLEPGASLVLYTDGLVERRGVAFEHGLSWLTGVLAGRQDLGARELCAHVIGQLSGPAEDDVALLVLKARPR